MYEYPALYYFIFKLFSNVRSGYFPEHWALELAANYCSHTPVPGCRDPRCFGKLHVALDRGLHIVVRTSGLRAGAELYRVTRRALPVGTLTVHKFPGRGRNLKRGRLVVLGCVVKYSIVCRITPPHRKGVRGHNLT